MTRLPEIEDGSCLLSEHLSPVDESACNPKPKSLRQTGRTPFNLGHNDLANDSLIYAKSGG
jgi:hypothetical protein